jgi:hypothetical protein
MFTEILKNFQTNFPVTDLKNGIPARTILEIDEDETRANGMKMITELCGTMNKKMDRS